MILKPDEFSPNCTAFIEFKRGVTEAAAEDWGTPYVIMYFGMDDHDWYWIVSKKYRHAIASYDSLSVARNFARRFSIDFPAYDETVMRVISGRYSVADADYLRLAEERKRHVSYSLPPGIEMMLSGKI